MNEHVIDIIPVRHPDDHVEVQVEANSPIEALEQALAVLRGRMRAVRIAGDYHGPSYGNPGYPSYEGFSSVKQAVDRFRARQETSGSYGLASDELTVSQAGYITHVTPERNEWPGTSAEDTLELYRVFVTDDGERVIASEPFARLSAGPRGGVVRENY